MVTEMREARRTGHKRKVRKGTHSCWECRRRKIRCQFATPSDSVCVTCSARGTPCVSQDTVEIDADRLPSEGLLQRDGDVLDRLRKLEDIVQSLPGEARGSSNAITFNDRPVSSESSHRSTRPPSRRAQSSTHTATINDVSSFRTVEETPTGAMMGTRDMLAMPHSSQIERPEFTCQYSKDEKLRNALFDLLPPTEVTMALVLASPGATMVSMLFHSHQEISQGRFQKLTASSWHLLRKSHPIILSKRLLQLAICVQHLKPECSYLSLKDQVYLKGAAADNVTTVMELVTSRDELASSLDGVECLVLLALFQLNAGNLRRSWLTVRRAINIAQLLDLNDGVQTQFHTFDETVPPGAGISPRWLWFRAVFFDRCLSLFLGLSPAVQDSNFANLLLTDNYDQMERLETSQTILTGRILERNAMMKRKDDNAAFSMTHLIDGELDAAAEKMGSEWWNLSSINTHDPTSSSRLLLQIHHHTLKLYLHLPYLLRREPRFGGRQGGRYDHSRASCATFARANLRLFDPYRTLHPSASACRHIDYSAVIACMTLLLGYLADQPPHLEAGHHDPDAQRQEDLKLIQSVHDRLQLVAETCEDTISRDFAAFVARLVPIIRFRDSGSRTSEEFLSKEPESRPITFSVPHLGTVFIRPWALDFTNISIDRIVDSLSELTPQISTPEPVYSTDSPVVDGSSSTSKSSKELRLQNSLTATRPGLSPSPIENTSLISAPAYTFQADADGRTAAELPAISLLDADLSPEFWPLQGLDTNFWDLLQQGMDNDYST
ncbi:hypothetical protein BO86DRAFT_412644 [Aspergillus japonicus CBS 114.51]|uniref:Zn(2)-C6 fungal-type domain-containing protein n=1 Tax=Aspergillus japonicus CBS 114.51 TaxID=1448312 RepID=A0A8T8WQR6_ASPJA|nr:hypothetical protein BO86DRAFT_412644 [Aspergillus japonicus CBS 114.51]RAH78034.1 hypothetical protein BO86DRAFT_412644 [Aspergillus japonicus CBS 114.51]